LSHPRRPAFLPALFVIALAGLVSACGVKGDLEAPAMTPEAKAAAAAAPTEPVEPSTKSVFVERSVVQSGQNPRDILPKMPPKEWEKKKVEEQERKARAIDSRKPNPNDRPFILDGLL
jgi:predicted small lipoprotein YifL